MAKTEQTGLYDATNEHDACGVGMVVNIHGNKSHELVDSALKVLENMRHRGAEGADNKTGDGAGIMLQIPHEFILLQGCLLYTSFIVQRLAGVSNEDGRDAQGVVHHEDRR